MKKINIMLIVNICCYASIMPGIDVEYIMQKVQETAGWRSTASAAQSVLDAWRYFNSKELQEAIPLMAVDAMQEGVQQGLNPSIAYENAKKALENLIQENRDRIVRVADYSQDGRRFDGHAVEVTAPDITSVVDQLKKRALEATTAWKTTPEGRLHGLWNSISSTPAAISSRLTALSSATSQYLKSAKTTASSYISSTQTAASPYLDSYIIKPMATALAQLGGGIVDWTPSMVMTYLQKNFPYLAEQLSRMDPVKRNQYIGVATTVALALTSYGTFKVYKWFNQPTTETAESSTTSSNQEGWFDSIRSRLSRWWSGQ